MALDIFYKILKGLELKHEGKPHFLIGSAHHNIGLVKMLQQDFEGALASFSQAVAMRRLSLPERHVDIGVSLFRQAVAQFALGTLGDAVVSLELALSLVYRKKTVSRAKILNNLGVVQYQRQDCMEALKGFTEALEIQRQ